MNEHSEEIMSAWMATFHALGAKKAAAVIPLDWFASGWEAKEQRANARIEQLKTRLANERAANDAMVVTTHRAERLIIQLLAACEAAFCPAGDTPEEVQAQLRAAILATKEEVRK